MTDKKISVTAHDLPLQCPPQDDQAWAQHPRVFLDVTKTGEVKCPYCGAEYVFSGDLPKGHH